MAHDEAGRKAEARRVGGGVEAGRERATEGAAESRCGWRSVRAAPQCAGWWGGCVCVCVCVCHMVQSTELIHGSVD